MLNTMTLSEHVDYCRQKAAPLGSQEYMRLRRLPSAIRQPALALLTLYQAIAEIPFTVSEREIAYKKCEWWREQVDALVERKGAHPGMVILAQTKLNTNVITCLRNLIDSSEQLIAGKHYPNLQSLRDFYRERYAIAEMLLLLLTNETLTVPQARFCHLAGSVSEMVYRLNVVRRDLERGFCFFAESEMQACGVTIEELLRLELTTGCRQLFLNTLTHTSQTYHELLTLLQTEKSLHPYATKAHLAMAQGKLIAREDFPLFKEQVYLTPIQHWLLSKWPSMV